MAKVTSKSQSPIVKWIIFNVINSIMGLIKGSMIMVETIRNFILITAGSLGSFIREIGNGINERYNRFKKT